MLNKPQIKFWLVRAHCPCQKGLSDLLGFLADTGKGSERASMEETSVMNRWLRSHECQKFYLLLLDQEPVLARAEINSSYDWVIWTRKKYTYMKQYIYWKVSSVHLRISMKFTAHLIEIRCISWNYCFQHISSWTRMLV